MKKITLLILLILVLIGCNNKTTSLESNVGVFENPFQPVDSGLTKIELDKMNYNSDDEIKIQISDTTNNDYLALFDFDGEPGISTPYTKVKTNHQKEIIFSLKELNLVGGDYAICLYQNKTFRLLDRQSFQIDDDENDYMIKTALPEIVKNGKKTTFKVKIVPSVEKELTYSGYWCKDGQRLKDYKALFRIKKGNVLDGFEVVFNENIFMPFEANELEICVTEGKSTSYFIKMSDELKITSSKYRYNFQVLTDIHANPDARYGHWSSHFYHALLDIKCLAGNTTGVFTVGDNTDMGSSAHYDHLFATIKEVFAEDSPNFYYTVGNHDYMYSSDSVGGFERAMEVFKRMTGMENSYYAIDLNDTKYIFLSSDEKTVSGAINAKQLDWFKAQLLTVDKNKFAFVFLHQPLINTTAGTLPGQNWYGMENVAEEMQNLLKDYPNVLLFTGHTHYALECQKATNFGHGVNANYIHNGSVAYLWTDTYEETVGGQCNFIEVYDDYLLIKGRDLFENKWVSSAQFVCYLY